MQTTLVGFESTWGNSVGLAGRRLNRSGKDGHKGRVRALQGGRKLPPRCQILVTSPSNKELAARAHLGCAGLGSLSFFLSFFLSLSLSLQMCYRALVLRTPSLDVWRGCWLLIESTRRAPRRKSAALQSIGYKGSEKQSTLAAKCCAARSEATRGGGQSGRACDVARGLFVGS